MHSVASLWCMSQKKHLLKCGWNREADMRLSSAYSVQYKYHNHLLHSEYCSIPSSMELGKLRMNSILYLWEFPVFLLCLTFFFFNKLYHRFFRNAGCLERKQLTGNSCTVLQKDKVRSGVCVNMIL